MAKWSRPAFYCAQNLFAGFEFWSFCKTRQCLVEHTYACRTPSNGTLLGLEFKLWIPNWNAILWPEPYCEFTDSPNVLSCSLRRQGNKLEARIRPLIQIAEASRADRVCTISEFQRVQFHSIVHYQWREFVNKVQEHFLSQPKFACFCLFELW